MVLFSGGFTLLRLSTIPRDTGHLFSPSLHSTIFLNRYHYFSKDLEYRFLSASYAWEISSGLVLVTSSAFSIRFRSEENMSSTGGIDDFHSISTVIK